MIDREYMGQLVLNLNQTYGLGLQPDLTTEELEAALAAKLNMLIQDDFSALVQLLYRIDVNEARLRQLLQSNPGEDAGRLIAQMIIERQRQKIFTRHQYAREHPKEGAAPATEGPDWEDV